MAFNNHWDFNCPQYVDFLAGIDDNADDIYFDCSDNFSPGDRKERNLPVPVNGLTEEAENKLINKMTAALSYIENTPKIKTHALKGRLFSEKTPVKTPGIHVVKPVMKSTVHRPFARIHSKSMCGVNKAHIDKPMKAKDFIPRRSSSLTDLRTIKKHTYPRTPLCLKRTIHAKHKVVKTSEEMELEQIATLQKKLSQLLRNNEISYRKMKLRQKPCVQKNVEGKSEIPKGNAGTDKSIRRNFHAMSSTAMKQESLKLESIMKNKDSTNKPPKTILKDILERSKNPSVSTSIISETCDKSREQVSQKQVNYGFHSGLVFTDSFKKNTNLKPFKFETRVKEMSAQKAGTDQKPGVSLTRSVSKDNINNGKENIPVLKPNSALKLITTDVQKIRADMKLLGSNKIFGQGNKNPMRGLPLAENTFRN